MSGEHLRGFGSKTASNTAVIQRNNCTAVNEPKSSVASSEASFKMFKAHDLFTAFSYLTNSK